MDILHLTYTDYRWVVLTLGLNFTVGHSRYTSREDHDQCASDHAQTLVDAYDLASKVETVPADEPTGVLRAAKLS